MILTRRSFLSGLIAAPLIVRPGVLMPVRAVVMSRWVPTLDPTPRQHAEIDLIDFDVESAVKELGRLIQAETYQLLYGWPRIAIISPGAGAPPPSNNR